MTFSPCYGGAILWLLFRCGGEGSEGKLGWLLGIGRIPVHDLSLSDSV